MIALSIMRGSVVRAAPGLLVQLAETAQVKAIYECVDDADGSVPGNVLIDPLREKDNLLVTVRTEVDFVYLCHAF
jgi:hypothetical protein